MRDISMHILDILQNSIRAKSKNIAIVVEKNRRWLTFCVKDDGCGMSPLALTHAAEPFFTTRESRQVGLGLSLLKQNAEMTGGSFSIRSRVGVGTEVEASFKLVHADCRPVGDIASTVALTLSSYPSICFSFDYQGTDHHFGVNTRQVEQALGGMPLQNAKAISRLTKKLSEDIREADGIN